MKLVIDIPEDEYEYIKENGFNGYSYQRNLIVEAISSGIPLPKGHGDLKDANNFFNDELDAKLAECKVEQNIFKDIVRVKDIIKYAPTVIEADGGTK